MSSEIQAEVAGLAPVLVVREDVVELAQTLQASADALPAEIDDEAMLEYVDGLFSELHSLGKQIEGGRIEAKRPVLELGRAIDGAAKPLLQQVDRAKSKASALLAAWQRKVREAEIAAERERLEAEEAALAAVAQAEVEANAKESHATAAPAPVVIEEPKTVVPQASASVGTRKRTVLIIDDPAQIPWQVDVKGKPEVLLKLNEPAIKRALKAGVKIPGCCLATEETVAARPKR